MEENINEIVILDELEDKDSSDSYNNIPISSFEQATLDEEEVKKRAMYAIRGQKISATRKANSKYKKNVSRAVQALADSTYCTLSDGTELSGADIIAIGLFDKAVSGDLKATKLFLETAGDLTPEKNEEDKNKDSIEEVLKRVKVEF